MDGTPEWLRTEEPWYNESRLRKKLEETAMDAVVVRSGQNVVYLSGMRIPGTLGRHQDFVWSPRPILVVWPVEGAPVLVANAINRDLAGASSWIDDIRTYTEYEESPWEICGDYLEELGLDDGRIGFEKREINVPQWREVEETFPDADLCDCTDLLTAVRNVKTEKELELLRTSVTIQDEAHEEVFRDASPGATERDLHARMLQAMVHRGAEWGHGMMQSNNTRILYGGEGPVEITNGDLVKTDYVSYFNGYAANLSRMAVMGRPSATQKRRYQELLEVHRSLIEEVLRPGITGDEVWNALNDRLREKRYTDAAGLAGHSTGVWWHQEEPILRSGEETTLKPGMVVCLEPIIEKYWHIQDQILITDDGAELISDGFDTNGLFVMK